MLTDVEQNPAFVAAPRVLILNYVHFVRCSDDVGSCKDHHAAIGKGKIGLDCFKWIMNEPLFDNLPIVLETPVANHKAEIELLYSFCR